MKYTNNLFESIKDALNKKTGSSENANYKDFLKLEPDNTYVVRLVPNLKLPQNTMYHYYHHIWRSCVTNQYISVLCPNTYEESCPIDQYRAKIYNSKNEGEMERIKPLKRNENWLCNVFVLKDPTNPDNQGQLKVLKFGKQLYKIISSAMSGDDSDEFGARIFDLSENGCNLRIKVELNEGGYPNYNSSRFTSPSKIEGVDDVSEIYSSVKELDTIFEHKTNEEIINLLNTHFLGKETESVAPSVTEHTAYQTSAFDAPVEIKDSDVSISNTGITESSTSDESLLDAKIEDILKDL